MPSWTALRVAGNVLWCFLRHGSTLTLRFWNGCVHLLCVQVFRKVGSSTWASHTPEPYQRLIARSINKPKNRHNHPKTNIYPLCFQPKEIHWKPSKWPKFEVMPSLVILPDTVSYSLGSDQWPWASALLQAPRTKQQGTDELEGFVVFSEDVRNNERRDRKTAYHLIN